MEVHGVMLWTCSGGMKSAKYKPYTMRVRMMLLIFPRLQENERRGRPKMQAKQIRNGSLSLEETTQDDRHVEMECYFNDQR